MSSAEHASLRLLEIWHALRKHWKLIGAGTALVASLGFVWTYRQPKMYSATCSVVIETSAPQVLENVKEVVALGTGTYWTNKEFYETQYRIISSEAVAGRVIARLGLASDPDFHREDGGRLVEALLRRLRVLPVRDSRIALITVEDRKPERAAQIANAFAETYLEYNLDYKLEGTKNATVWLAEQEQDLRTKLEKSEMGLYQFKRDKNLLAVSLDDKQSMTSQNLQHINQKLADVRAKRIELEAERKIIVAARDNPEERESLPEIRQNTVIQELQRKLVELGTSQADLETRYGEKHPKVVEMQRQIQAVRRDYDGQMGSILKAFEKQYQALVDTEKALVSWMEREKKEAIELSKLELEYKPLSRDAENAAKVYGMVNQREKEASLSGSMRANNARILERASAPRFPSRPRVLVNMALALLFGLLGSAGLAVVIEAADNTVKGQSELERALSVPVLGIIPVVSAGSERKGSGPESLRERDLSVFKDARSSAAEAYRSLRTNLLFLSPDSPIRTILVTSPGPQEGKTTSAIALGITLGQAGSRTLLVDTDMRRPRLHRAFGVSNEMGVSTAIVDSSPLVKLIRRTEVPNLDVLTCGPIPPNPAELLHTERFRRVLSECGGSYDRIIFDSPPTSAVTDPAIIGHLVDGVLLVVKEGQTTRHAAAQAKRQLDAAKARILGVVLNEVDLSNRSYGYYSYYRTYSRYSQPESEAESKT